MATFITDLWESVFVAGPTPTLIVATNAAFAGLQLILFLLLVATYSIHFVILSFLSAGLWFAINWFVRELSAAQALEDEKAKSRSDEARSGSDSETEAETVIDTEDIGTGSKAVEVLERKGELKARGDRSSGSKSEMSTEDEWEKVSENENEKDK